MRNLDLTAPEVLTDSLVISASAGSGKTFTLSVLVTATLGQGLVRPFEILGTTFSEASAADLRERLLRPLDLLASLSVPQWKDLLPRIRTADTEGVADLLQGFDLPGSLQKSREEVRWAAAHWSEAPWTASASGARAFWQRLRREAELLQVATLHGLALTLLAQGAGAPEAILDAQHPALLRLLRQALREALDQPETDPDHAPGRTLLTWARWKWDALSAGYDGHRDALGDLARVDLAPHHRTLMTALDAAEAAFGPFVAHPELAVDAASPSRRFFSAAQIRPLPAPDADLAARIQWAEAQSSAATDPDGQAKGYHAASFAEALRSLSPVADAWEALLGAQLANALLRFEALKQAQGMATFGDLVRSASEGLAQAAITPPRPKLLLVDEVQDTSAAQEAFLAALEAQRTVRVGDLKQAIYGFRGGDPALLRGHLQAAGDRAFRLPANYRSAPPVVDLANTYVDELWPRLDPGAADLDGQQLSLGKTGHPVGLVRTQAQDAWPDLPSLAPWIRVLSREEGWSAALGTAVTEGPRRRALLLKQRTRLPSLLRKLKAGGIRPYVLAKEGFWESPGVRLTMAALEAVAHPDRPLPCVVLLRHVAGLTDGELTALAQPDGLPGLGGLNVDRLPEPARALGAWLCALQGASAQELAGRLLGQGSLLRFLAGQRVHGPLEPHRARRNLAGFLALLMNLPASPAAAFALLEELRNGVEKGDLPAASADADLIIQTAHASKGLEYEDVILPLLNARPHGLTKGEVRTHPDGRLALAWKLGHHKGQAYQALAPEVARRQRQDDLNLLYVALTRARERMCLLLQEPPAKAAPKPAKGKAGDPPPMPGTPDYAGAKTWSALGGLLADLHGDLKPLEAPPEVGLPEPAAPPRPEPPAPRPSLATEPGEPPEKAFDPRASAQARQDGELVHAYLQDLLMRWDDPEAFQARLDAPPKVPHAKEVALRFLAQFEARGWRPLRRRTEYPIAGAAATGALGFADLVVWEADRIQLLDFKHAKGLGPLELAAYQRQLARYARALSAGGLPVTATLVALRSGEWVEVEV